MLQILKKVSKMLVTECANILKYCILTDSATIGEKLKKQNKPNQINPTTPNQPKKSPTNQTVNPTKRNIDLRKPVRKNLSICMKKKTVLLAFRF